MRWAVLVLAVLCLIPLAWALVMSFYLLGPPLKFWIDAGMGVGIIVAVFGLLWWRRGQFFGNG